MILFRLPHYGRKFAIDLDSRILTFLMIPQQNVNQQLRLQRKNKQEQQTADEALSWVTNDTQQLIYKHLATSIPQLDTGVQSSSSCAVTFASRNPWVDTANTGGLVLPSSNFNCLLCQQVLLRMSKQDVEHVVPMSATEHRAAPLQCSLLLELDCFLPARYFPLTWQEHWILVMDPSSRCFRNLEQPCCPSPLLSQTSLPDISEVIQWDGKRRGAAVSLARATSLQQLWWSPPCATSWGRSTLTSVGRTWVRWEGVQLVRPVCLLESGQWPMQEDIFCGRVSRDCCLPMGGNSPLSLPCSDPHIAITCVPVPSACSSTITGLTCLTLPDSFHVT